MNAVWAGTLAVLAGVVLVVQSELLATISQRHGTWLALLLNSTVGMPLILALAAQQSRSSFSNLTEDLRWWYLLPGLLGTCFVATNATAYAKLGPVAAATIIITAQLVTALMTDWIGLSGSSHSVTLARLLGVGLMLLGCFLAVPK
jgi:bacterial/archaeal transporter family-2 protein